MKTIKEEFENLDLKDKINENLKLSFEEAKSDPIFDKFTKKLNCNDKILSKYTSTLKKCSLEYNNCLNCKNILECKNEIAGFAYLPKIKNNVIIFNYKACKHKEKILAEKKYLKNISLFQATDQFLDHGLDKIDTKDKKRHEVIKLVVKFVKDYPNIKKGIYMHGSFGAGKSFILNAMLVELAKNNIKSTIIFWPEFIRNLKTYFGSKDNIEFNNLINQIKNTPILLIDDIGAENISAWSRDEILFTILDHRMNNKLATFFTSNLNLEELEKHFSQTKDGIEIVKARRIMERIKQLAEEVQLISKNLRS